MPQIGDAGYLILDKHSADLRSFLLIKSVAAGWPVWFNAFVGPNPVYSIQYPVSSIQHPVSSIKYPASTHKKTPHKGGVQ
jgi:hypothetical protein